MIKDQKLIERLEEMTVLILQQADGHAIQSRIFFSQGFTKLANKYSDHAKEERDYAERIMDRILDLGGDLKNGARKELPIYKDAIEWIKYDYELTKKGLDFLKEAIDISKVDLTTYDLLKDYYKDEEEDMYWGEQQLELIEIIGEKNWYTLNI